VMTSAGTKIRSGYAVRVRHPKRSVLLDRPVEATTPEVLT
jgi:hypothetical protein